MSVNHLMEGTKKSMDSLAFEIDGKGDNREKLPAINGHHSARSIGSEKALPDDFSGTRAGTRAGKRGLVTLGSIEENKSIKPPIDKTVLK